MLEGGHTHVVAKAVPCEVQDHEQQGERNEDEHEY
jgi:hypothetical protein